MSLLIEEQSSEIFAEFGIVIPVRSCSLMTSLAKLGSASASDLASALEQSHQLVLQKLPKLVQLGLLVRTQDETDARRKLFSLTDEGIDQLEKFDRCSVLLRKAYAELFAEVGDINLLISNAIDALNQKPLCNRLSDST
ncbi:MarR family transcriptional regulator [Parasphingorhabdus litoris]|nr:MarR family transcriptional regulator [Parasphingorhabdus litoris]